MEKIFIQEGDPYYSTKDNLIKPGVYELERIIEGGLVDYPQEVIFRQKYELVVVEKIYFEHGNGD